jgi:dolichol-phosphate mannosyltransferase
VKPVGSTVRADEARHAAGTSAASVATLIVPTYREVDGVAELVRRVAAVRDKAALDLDLLLVDDDSRDGIEALVGELRRERPWLRLLVRRGRRSLSGAVVEGFRHASGATLIVADADLSHPVETVPAMLAEIAAGADLVVGSRYVAGGSVAPGWGPLRRIASRIGCVLARGLTPVRDPLSGFFALRGSLLTANVALAPVGFKIGLELLVRLPLDRVVEVPIRFACRSHGRSKLRLRQQLLFLVQLARLYGFALQRRLRRSQPESEPA